MHQARDLANMYLALDADLKIIPCLNRSLPAAQPYPLAPTAGFIGCDPARARVERQDRRGQSRPAARNRPAVTARRDPDAPARGLIFDSISATYRGVRHLRAWSDGRSRARGAPESQPPAHETLDVE